MRNSKAMGRSTFFGMLCMAGIVAQVSFAQAQGPVQGRLGSVRSADSAREPATRPVTGSDLSEQPRFDMPVLSPFVIIRPPSGGKSDQPYSEVEYGRIIRSLMKIGGIPLAINYTPGQSILPENFEREALRAPSRISPIVTKAIDVLDRGIIVVPTRESVRLRGVRIPSQFSGSEASRAAAREAMRILREISRSGEIAIVPGVPVRDSSGAILVVIRLENGETLNSLLVREGLAMTEPSDFGTVGTAESAQLQRLQTEARRNRSGLWGRR